MDIRKMNRFCTWCWVLSSMISTVFCINSTNGGFGENEIIFPDDPRLNLLNTSTIINQPRSSNSLPAAGNETIVFRIPNGTNGTNMTATRPTTTTEEPELGVRQMIGSVNSCGQGCRYDRIASRCRCREDE